MRNGADLTSFTLQAQYSDLTNEYRRMTGARITSLGVSATAQSIMTGSVGFGGKRVTRETSTAARSAPTAATENEVMSEVDSFDGFWIDGAEETNYSLTSVNLNIAASGRPLRGLGALENKAMQLGPLEVTGSIEMYLDATPLTKRGSPSCLDSRASRSVLPSMTGLDIVTSFSFPSVSSLRKRVTYPALTKT